MRKRFQTNEFPEFRKHTLIEVVKIKKTEQSNNFKMVSQIDKDVEKGTRKPF